MKQTVQQLVPALQLDAPIELQCELSAAFLLEARLLADLRNVLEVQRQAVAAARAAEVEESVYAAHRVLRTLEEARRRRRSLVERIAGEETFPLEELETVFPGRATTELLLSRDQLVEGAHSLNRQIGVNRRALHSALIAGERIERAVEIKRYAGPGPHAG